MVTKTLTRAGAVLAATLAACSVVNAPDAPKAEDDDGGGASTSTSSTGGSGASGGGGASGDCQGPADCTSLTDECNTGACEAGSCVAKPAPSGATCGDPGMSVCGQPDTCDGAGTCAANNQPDGTVCDSDLCADSQQCMGGACAAGTPKDCSNLTVGCNKGVCASNDGSCTTMLETTCMTGDDCCPSGCNENNDDECALPTGTVRNVNGPLVTVVYVPCGSGAPGQCTAAAARTACGNLGRKVVAHASNGTSQVLSLGATTSCNWSISYFTVGVTMPSGSCLVGVSNLDWTTCCNSGNWHGNTVDFGVVNTTFGYVDTNNSGFVSTNPNVSGATWGCVGETTAATNQGSCTTQYVACAQ
jgi:hypothetical protein